MEFFSLIQNGQSKMADGCRSFFNSEWRHHDITAIVKVHKCVFQLLFISIFLFEGKNWWNLDFATVKSHHFVNHIILCDFGGRIISGFKVTKGELQKCPFPPGCRKYKKSPVWIGVISLSLKGLSNILLLRTSHR